MSESKGKILVLDDDRLVLAMVVHGLVQAGYEVIDADNGDEAILLAREHRPELALLDIRMEGKTGFDVAQYLRDVLAIPFLFLSAFSDEATVAKVRELGAVAYLVKPLQVGQIIPTIEAALAQVRQRRQSAQAPVTTDVAATELDVVAVALGVLMHRYSLSRVDAKARLQRSADQEGRTLQAQAERIVDAVEALAQDGLKS
jgi:two-component system, response regulator PdtaR